MKFIKKFESKKRKNKKRVKILNYTDFDKTMTWSPDFNKNSPAPSASISIGPLK